MKAHVTRWRELIAQPSDGTHNISVTTLIVDQQEDGIRIVSGEVLASRSVTLMI
jgi:hypothetical protein